VLASNLSLKGVEKQQCLDWVRLCHVFIRGSIRAEIEQIVHRMSKILLAAKIALSRQNRSMSEQELDLFQFSAI
jgi:hypothetical protein